MNNLLGTFVEVDEIVGFLRRDLQFKEVCQKAVSQKVIERATQERGIVITPEEIQSEVECFRRENRLEKAAETMAWLAEQMITVDDWEIGIRNRLSEKKLAEELFGKEVEKFFAQNRMQFDQALLYQIVVPYEQLSKELFFQIEEEEISFYQAAHLYDIDEDRRQKCGFEGKVHRWNLNPEIAAAVFSASVGQLLSPIKTPQGYHLILVEDLIIAELTPEKHQEILDRMFKEWLASEINYFLLNRS